MKRSDGYRMTFVVVGFVTGLVVGGQSVRAATTNQAPIADAGLSRYAAKDPIVLDGAGSYDPDNSGPLSYAWRQIAGQTVVITDPNTATPTIGGFVQTDEIQECEFELVVSDGELTSLPDTVKVIIVPDFGYRTLRHVNPPFDRNKPTVMFFGGGDCVTGSTGWDTTQWIGWDEKANIIIFPTYGPDSVGGSPTYYRCGDRIIVYLSSVAPDYKQPIQAIGYSTGGQPAIDVGIHLNLTYADARYAVNRVTLVDVGVDICRNYTSSIITFVASSVDGEQCWIDEYYGVINSASGTPHTYFSRPDELFVSLGLEHGPVMRWYRNSFTGNDMNTFNNGLVAGAYWSVIGPGKNLQLAPTDAYYFRWDGGEQSGGMSIYDEALHPGRLPEPVTLVGPVDGAYVDANGVVLSCELSENAVGYQLIFGHDPYHMVYLFSDTPAPPSEPVSAFPFEQTWWTVRAYDLYGSTIHADPMYIHAESVIAQPIANAATGQTYDSIQQAINDAHPGDEIVVSPGTCQYRENINFKGKNLTVRSTDPNDPDVVAATVINGGYRLSVITLSGSKDEGCVLDGLTIIGGIVGVSCQDGSLTIRNCTIVSNGPNAIEFWYGCEPTIIDCTILGQVVEVEDPTLVAHWALDETEGVIAADSAGEHDGTLIGGPVWQPIGGIVDGALEFDGINDWASTPFVLNPADGSFSVFTWLKGGAPAQVLISQQNGANWLMLDPADGTLMTELRGSHNRSRYVGPLASEATVTDDDWHRVGLVWDGSNRTLYVDDMPVAEDTQADLASSTGGLYIGAGSKLEAGSFFSGLIDDVVIFNRAVTP